MWVLSKRLEAGELERLVALGSPSRTWDTAGHPTRSRPYHGVEYEVHVVEQEPHEALGGLLERIEPAAPRLQAIRQHPDIESIRLKVAIFGDYDNMPFYFPPHQLAAVAGLGFDLELDIYLV